MKIFGIDDEIKFHCSYFIDTKYCSQKISFNCKKIFEDIFIKICVHFLLSMFAYWKVLYYPFLIYFYSPAGRLKTPAPTIFFTKLKISLGMVAVPPPTSPPPDTLTAPEAAVI